MKPEGTVNSEDRDKRRLTKPYKEHLYETLKTTDDYRGYLSACYEDDSETFALAVQDVLDCAATRMRDKCVVHLRKKGEHIESTANHLPGSDRARELHAEARTFYQAAREVESLTLDPPVEKQ